MVSFQKSGKQSKWLWFVFAVVLRLLVVATIAIPVTNVAILLGSISPPTLRNQVSVDDETSGGVSQLPVKTSVLSDGTVIIPEEEEDVLLRKEGFYTFLIFGTDTLGGNTDTIMVASYDTVNKEAHVVSIPRDIKVNTERRGLPKINAAYAYGKKSGASSDGVEALLTDISSIVGFRPDFYVMLDLKAFIRLVDAIDGVEIDVKMSMLYSDPGQNLYINIKKGVQIMDGKTALGYARYRTGSSSTRGITDYERIEHQQEVVKAVIDKALKLENMTKLPEFIDIFVDNVDTDMTVGNLLWFAGKLNDVRNADSLFMHTLYPTSEVSLPAYYSFVDAVSVLELVNSTVNPYTYDITEDMLNLARP